MMILDNNIGSEGVKALAASLGQLNRLSKLSLRGIMCVKAKCVSACIMFFFLSDRLWRCLFCVCFVLVSPTMTPGNNIGPEGAKALAPSLAQLSWLNKLGLHGA